MLITLLMNAPGDPLQISRGVVYAALVFCPRNSFITLVCLASQHCLSSECAGLCFGLSSCAAAGKLSQGSKLESNLRAGLACLPSAWIALPYWSMSRSLKITVSYSWSGFSGCFRWRINLISIIPSWLKVGFCLYSAFFICKITGSLENCYEFS